MARVDPWNQKPERHPAKAWLIGGGIVVALVLAFLVIRPAWTGYAVYSALDGHVPDEYIRNMMDLQQAKEAAEATAVQATADARDAQDMAAQAEQDRMACRDQLNAVATDASSKEKLSDELSKSFSRDIALAREQIDACNTELAALKDASDPVVSDAARRLCCIERNFNTNINSYEIEDDRIVCGAGLENEVTC
jgi:hypothetical protein